MRRSQRGNNQLVEQSLGSLAMHLLLHLLLQLLLPLAQRMPSIQQARQARRRGEAVGALRWTSLSGNGRPLQGGVGWGGLSCIHMPVCTCIPSDNNLNHIHNLIVILKALVNA